MEPKNMLHSIELKQDEMVKKILELASIHAHKGAQDQFEPLRKKIRHMFSPLGGKCTYDGTLMTFSKRPEAAVQILLGGHLDIALSEGERAEKPKYTSSHLIGRGVADMKGGLIVALTALQAFEQFHGCTQLGWTFFMNEDEETGSPLSTPAIRTLARGKRAALLFEPALPSGKIVSERKGSFTGGLFFRGKSAHAGRDFHQGRNAVIAAAECAVLLDTLSEEKRGITVNVAQVRGGGALNIVPEKSDVQFNLRAKRKSDLEETKEKIKAIGEQVAQKRKVKFDYKIFTERPPKHLDTQTQALYSTLKQVGHSVGVKVTFEKTGGVCDGNTTSSVGTPTIDTLGVVGSALHTADESFPLSCLVKRAKLSAALLVELTSTTPMI